MAPLDLLADVLAILVSGLAGVMIRSDPVSSSPVQALLVLTLVVCASHAGFGLYAERRSVIQRCGLGAILAANVVAWVICCGPWGLPAVGPLPWGICGAVLALNTVLSASARSLVRSVLRNARAAECRTVLLGNNGLADRLTRYIGEHRPGGIEIVRRMGYDPGDSSLSRNLRRSVRNSDADLVICVDEGGSLSSIMEIIAESASLGISTKVLSQRMEILSSRARQRVETFEKIPLVHFQAPPIWPGGHWVARLLSIIAAAVALVVLLPLMLCVGLLIRVTSPGPALFVQERIGMNRKPFWMYKFRTMVNGADSAQPEVEQLNEADGTLFKVRDDPRITPLGRFLRKFSIDELPQLLNVVKGEMALVGPRPLPRRDYANYYENWHYNRHAGHQGLTCLWQVSGRAELDFESMCILDIYYLRNRGVRLDLEILLRTVGVVALARGAC